MMPAKFKQSTNV